jgi:ATP-dependent Clp protease protease subunit
MIHQPLGGASGQASDILIRAKHMERTRTRLTELLSAYTGKDTRTLLADMDRDYFMTAGESAAYGLVDKVIFPAGKKQQETA